eukprot:Gregarina_sp_Poly_1__7963@NODE_455_length_8267_cov_220_739024_g370_i0_p2_GENE_NODE_455_length_8267_cov_220_739024_g370_i0NODE_455_length_8267_cov_220_739024_g370_i0_p2_ORF_typecomplete_len279_score39_74P5CR_dimer/PF14748_6/2_3e34F420_oxidored/PF03807_17/9_8e18Rossmannlike/PF10727_9/1_2e06NAD_binding_2/PF03446_15/0_0015NAD_binding_2/PF03446_15/7_5e03PDH/PF02153_17/0_0038GFO_IDH_MocA/PF01408_22/0_036Semialdhyde_dh/PF01118_24/0_12NAD_Gly3P_dh_N/PF01210_23/4_3e03NAD_Gly3P_dh_N/PF01210_23/0_19NAD_Gly
MTSDPYSVAFIGFGMMGQALMGGCLRSGAIASGKAWAADPYTDFSRVPFVETYQVKCTRDNVEAIRQADIVFLAVKPFLLESIISDLANANVSMSDKLIVSMVSSFNLERLRSILKGCTRIIRIMPNTPALVGEGATAICAPPDASSEDVKTVETLMNGCGLSWVIPETRMNIWTAVAGCGPAFVFEILEAFADAAVVRGIARDTANQMVCQLVLGSAKMALESEKHFGELKDNVCSPNGATIAGVQQMREEGVQGSIMKTVTAARERYDEIEKDPTA